MSDIFHPFHGVLHRQYLLLLHLRLLLLLLRYDPEALDQILRGLIKGHAQAEDVFIGEAMTSKMFMDADTGVGLDLAAQIIQQVHFFTISPFPCSQFSHHYTMVSSNMS